MKPPRTLARALAGASRLDRLARGGSGQLFLQPREHSLAAPLAPVVVLLASVFALACGGRPPTSPTTTTQTSGSSGSGNACTTTLSLNQSTIGLNGGQLQLTVTTAAACQWTVTLPAWLRVVSKVSGTGTYSGVGTGTVTLWIEATSASSPRDGLISVGGASVRLYQATDCSITSRSFAMFDEKGGRLSFLLTTALPTCGWSLQADDWIQVQPAAGTGNATVTVSVPPSDSVRTGYVSSTGYVFGVVQKPAGAAQPLTFSSAMCGPIRPGESRVTLCWFFLQPGSNPTSSGLSVITDVRSIGGSESRGALAEMGTDGLGFSVDVSIPADLPPGTKSIPLIGRDAQGRTANAVVTMPVLPPR